MTAQLLLPEDVRRHRLTYGFFEDFNQFVSGDLFTDTSGDTGAAVANIDAPGGQVTLTTGATDNNECALLTTKEIFLFAASKPIRLEARAKFTEANTDDANVFVGLMNAIGADAMVDDGAGPKASFSGAGFYKVDSGTRWQLISSLGTTRTTTDLTAALSLDKLAKTSGGGAWQKLRIDVMPIDSTRAEVHFWIDDVHVATHDLTYTSATDMNAGAVMKAGGANSEVLYVDYIECFQTR